MNRRGFTLTELIMTLSVLALMGVALTRILISDTRFISKQDAMLTARQGARAALNTIVPELSMVADTVVFATRDSFQVRVPVAFGITCRLLPSTSTRIVSFLPVDSVAWAALDTTGMFWRQRSGVYTRINMTTTAAVASDSTRCQADSVRTLPGGRLLRIVPTSYWTPPESLAVAVMYSRVTYKFAASTDLPGRIGLWRKNWISAAEELVTPFDTSARFAYLMGDGDDATLTLQTTNVSSGNLYRVRGVELRLYAASEKSAQGTSSPQVFKLRTHVQFMNR